MRYDRSAPPVYGAPRAAPARRAEAGPLLEHWMGKLPEGERITLEPIVAAYPGAIEREQLREATGNKRSSSDTYVQRLPARHLVVEAGRGAVCASDTLFDGGR